MERMDRMTKKALALIFCLLIATMSYSGCLQWISEFAPAPEGPLKHPMYPAIAIDFTGNIHIVWENGTLLQGASPETEYIEHLSYLKLDGNGNKLTEITTLSYTAPRSPRIVIDSKNNIHIFSASLSGQLFYTKLTNDGQPLIKDKKVAINSSISHQDMRVLIDTNDSLHIIGRGNCVWHIILDGGGNTINELNLTPYSSKIINVEACLDLEDNLHISWLELKGNGSIIRCWVGGDIITGLFSEVYYTKQSKNGSSLVENVIITNSSILVYNAAITTDSNGNIYVFLNEYGDSSSFYMPFYDNPLGSYLKKFNKEGKLIYTTEITSMIIGGTWADSLGYLHIFGAQDNYTYGTVGIYQKVGINGSIILRPRVWTSLAENIVSPQSLKITQDVSKIHTYVVWHRSEIKEWRSGRRYVPYSFYTVYYSKLDLNGTVLIDQTVIDTDGEPSWETGEYTSSIVNTILLVVGIACAVLVSVIIVAFFLKRRKRKEASKTAPPKEKSPPPPW